MNARTKSALKAATSHLLRVVSYWLIVILIGVSLGNAAACEADDRNCVTFGLLA